MRYTFILLLVVSAALADCIQVREIFSASDVLDIEPEYDTDIWGYVDFAPVPAFSIDTHDPESQDKYISASVHEGKKPWDPFVWERIVSLTPDDAWLEGLVFVDVGANIGYFSLAAASMGYNVVAFEPMSRNAKKLAKSIEQNEFDFRMSLYQNAVSDKSGQDVVLRETDSASQGNGQIIRTLPAAEESQRTPEQRRYGVDYATSVTLSDVLDGVDAFILKIDVEGHEGKVLQGARGWICNNVVRHVIMEISEATRTNMAASGDSLGELFDFMNSTGYSVSDVAIGSGELDTTETVKLPPNVLFTLVYSNPICTE
jgi:FkbM family methyltransferase